MDVSVEGIRLGMPGEVLTLRSVGQSQLNPNTSRKPVASAPTGAALLRLLAPVVQCLDCNRSMISFD